MHPLSALLSEGEPSDVRLLNFWEGTRWGGVLIAAERRVPTIIVDGLFDQAFVGWQFVLILQVP